MTEPISPSPMGRHDLGGLEPGGRLYDVRMVGLPVELFLAARQQHDELMREFAVMALAHQDEVASEPPELRRLVREFGTHSATSVPRVDASVEAASMAGQATTELSYRVPISVLAAADRLEELMQTADAFCREGRMLTMPRSPQMRQFAAWWLNELRRQVAGNAPTPWAAAVASAADTG
jgi:hypothetical protein